jgi:hypothetical protein
LSVVIVAEATGLLDPYLTPPQGPTRADFYRAGFMHDAAYAAGRPRVARSLLADAPRAADRHGTGAPA